MILLDTDICIHILRGNKSVLDRRRGHADDVAVSFMTVGELFYGSEKSANPSKNRIVVEQFLLTVHIAESSRHVMERFGRLKASLERGGISLADADLLIAATALETCQLFVTGNDKHFKRIEELKLENWLN